MVPDLKSDMDQKAVLFPFHLAGEPVSRSLTKTPLPDRIFNTDGLLNKDYYFFTIFAHVSRRVTTLLNTGVVELVLSTQK